MPGNPLNDMVSDYSWFDTSRASLSSFIAGIMPFVGSSGNGAFGFRTIPILSNDQDSTGALYAHYYNTKYLSQLGGAVRSYQGGQVGRGVGRVMWNTGLAKRLGAKSLEDATISMQLAAGEPGGSSLIGAFADMLLGDAMGGSYGDSMAMAFANRRQLATDMDDKSYISSINPFDNSAMSRSMATTAMYLGMVNASINPNGVIPDLQFTKGLDRRTITKMGMSMAQAGAFNSSDGESLGRIIPDYVDKTGLVYGTSYKSRMVDENDPSKGYTIDIEGLDSTVDPGTADRIRAASKRIQDGLKAGVDTLAALRDLTGSAENLVERMDQLTQGEWKRDTRSAERARDDIMSIQATSMMYNIDPQQSVRTIEANKGMLRKAAGFTAKDELMGWDGGGMFSLHAQAAVMKETEDAISARGIDSNSPMATRYRMQQAQSMARSMNTSAGVGVQILASLYQNGSVSEEERDRLSGMITSGDASTRDSGLNDILVRWAGSRERGRTLMRDTNVINSIRQGLNAEAGAWALQKLSAGSRNEWEKRERLEGTKAQLSIARSMLVKAGSGSSLSNDEADAVMESMATKMAESGIDGADAYAGILRDQYKKMVKAGYSGDVALSGAMNFVNSTEDGARFSSIMSEAKDEGGLSAYKERLRTRGAAPSVALASIKALERMDSASGGKVISGDQANRLRVLVEKDPDAAIREIRRISSGLSSEQQAYVKRQGDVAKDTFDSQLSKLDAHDSAVRMLDSSRAYGASKSDLMSLAADSNFKASAPVITDASKAMVQRVISGQAIGPDASAALKELTEGKITAEEYKTRISGLKMDAAIKSRLISVGEGVRFTSPGVGMTDEAKQEAQKLLSRYDMDPEASKAIKDLADGKITAEEYKSRISGLKLDDAGSRVYGVYQASKSLGAANSALQDLVSGKISVEDYKVKLADSKLGEYFVGQDAEFMAFADSSNFVTKSTMRADRVDDAKRLMERSDVSKEASAALKDLTEGKISADEYKGRISKEGLDADSSREFMSFADSSNFDTQTTMTEEGRRKAVSMLRAKGSVQAELQMMAAKQSSAMGFDNSQLGFYGDRVIRNRAGTDELRAEMMKQIERDSNSPEIAKLRKTAVQDFLSFAAGEGTLSDVFRVMGPGAKYDVIGEVFGSEMSLAVSKKDDAIGAHNTAAADLIKMIDEGKDSDGNSIDDKTKASARAAMYEISQMKYKEGDTEDTINGRVEEVIKRRKLDGKAADAVRKFGTTGTTAILTTRDLDKKAASEAVKDPVDMQAKMGDIEKRKAALESVRQFHLDPFRRMGVFDIREGSDLAKKVDAAVSDDDAGVYKGMTDAEKLSVKAQYIQRQAAAGTLKYDTEEMKSLEGAIRSKYGFIPAGDKNTGQQSPGSTSGNGVNPAAGSSSGKPLIDFKPIIDRLDALIKLRSNDHASVGNDDVRTADGSSPAMVADSEDINTSGKSTISGTIRLIDGERSYAAYAQLDTSIV